MYHCNHCNYSYSELRQNSCPYCGQKKTFFQCSFEQFAEFLLVENTFTLNQVNSYSIQDVNVDELRQLLEAIKNIDVSTDIKKQQNKDFMVLKIEYLIKSRTA